MGLLFDITMKLSYSLTIWGVVTSSYYIYHVFCHVNFVLGSLVLSEIFGRIKHLHMYDQVH